MEERVKQFLAYAVDKAEAINEERRSVRFVISAEIVDRDKDVVDAKAVADAIKDFAKNPVCLSCHRHSSMDGMPTIVGSWDVASFAQKDGRSEMDLRFATTKLGEQWWTLYRDGHAKAVSIGFAIRNSHPDIIDGKQVYRITELELYEISCVPVGANQEALAKLKALGEAMGAEEREKAMEARLEERLEKRLKATIEEAFEEIKSLIIDDPGDLAKHLMGAGEDEALAAGGENDTAGKMMDTLQRLERIGG